MVPELFAQIMRAYRAGDLNEVAGLHKEIGRLSGIYAIGDDLSYDQNRHFQKVWLHDAGLTES